MIGFEFKIANRALQHLLHEAIMKAIPEQDMDIHGFIIRLKILGSPLVKAEKKSIQIALPLGVHFKRHAGLFTVEGHGKIHVRLDAAFDVTPDFMLSTKSSITDHIWIEKPVIDVGSMDITVEKLVDLILNHYQDIISHSIDMALKTKFDLAAVVNQLLVSLKRDLSSFNYHGLKIFMDPRELLIEPIANEGDVMLFKGGISTSLVCSVQDPFEFTMPKLRWVDVLMNDNITFMKVDIAEEVVSAILCDFINQQEYGGERLQADACTVDFAPGHMDVKLALSQPLKANVNLTAMPRYNEAEAQLYMDKLDINMKASNIIYRITAPLVNKFLEASFSEKLPIPVDQLIKEKAAKELPIQFLAGGIEINVNAGKISLVEMSFDDLGLKALARIEEFVVQGTMQ